MAESKTSIGHALLSGGGTGGHVFPALSVAQELKSRGWMVSFAGRPESMEFRAAREHQLHYLPVTAEPVVGRGAIRRLGALSRLARSGWAARRALKREGVEVVLGTGSYVSVPAVLGAHWAGIPSAIFEPNARAGAANRWLSRWAVEASVSYAETAVDLHCPARVTGVPVRQEFFSVRNAVPVANEMRILVLGGSQGARQINELFPAALERLLPEVPGLSVVHQCGRNKLEDTKLAYGRRNLRGAQIEIVPFIEDMAGAMEKAHLIVSRAGAVTLAEICAAGRAALLIPLTIAGGHQVDNARLLAESGGARILEFDEVTPDACYAELRALSRDPERVSKMGHTLNSLANRSAAQDIADRLALLGGVH